MTESGKKIVLYHASWCGHCKKFMPMWEELMEEFKKHGIKFEAYEEGENKDVMIKEEISSFPTIKITINGTTTNYAGKRTINDILKALGIEQDHDNNEIEEITDDPEIKQQDGVKVFRVQTGGAVDDEAKYKLKYLKYKTKYMKLVSELMH